MKLTFDLRAGVVIASSVVTAYHRFGQAPRFLEAGATAGKILNLPVGNLPNEPLGDVWSLILDIPKGRILPVVVLAPGNFKIPPSSHFD